ncbi:MAG: hypothetical protein GWO04_32730, partial [Actinobacteria bacterium]|nr:hypothetical protein [Actinomycetota bacterium]
MPFNDAGEFVCFTEDTQACQGNVFWSCERNPMEEFIRSVSVDCAAMEPPQACSSELGCVTCRPDSIGCDGNTVVQCESDGSAWIPQEECNVEEGFACRDGRCVNLCEEALANRSYVGCEFFSADLDNASIGAGRDASAQQYAVVVSNPGQVATLVSVEVNNAAFGEPEDIEEILAVVVPPGDLEVLELPRREVDGSSSNQMCDPSDR